VAGRGRYVRRTVRRTVLRDFHRILLVVE